jgi:hypothetical protein
MALDKNFQPALIIFSNGVLRIQILFLILFLKMYLGGGLAPSSQTVGSLLIPPGWQSWPGKFSEHSSNGFDKLKTLTKSDITLRTNLNRSSPWGHHLRQRLSPRLASLLPLILKIVGWAREPKSCL